MITELEARAYRHSFKQPEHPYKWGRVLGPLMVWTAFFALVSVGGFSDRLAPRELAIAVPSAQQAE